MDKVQELIEEYIGTCNSMDIDTLTIKELSEIDEAMFECECCGWWCDITERSKHKPCKNIFTLVENICNDCVDEE